MENTYTRLLLASGNKSATQIANDLGTKPANLGNWLVRGVSAQGLKKAAEVYGVSLDWLTTGRGEMRQFGFDANLIPISKTTFQKKPIPVLSKVQAGEWTKSNDMDELSDHDKWIDDFSGKWKPCLYALEVTGDSMTSDDPAHSFPEGGYVICDPEQNPTAGQFCIAKNTITQETTFKRFDSDGFSSFLSALNKDYPKIPIDNGHIRIIARAIEYVPKKPTPIKL